ncbi:MAG: hypothetical protein HWN65_10600 [Candidatus Helarchaeota archaeon]|nr:hypothetical protein [Candidatus Helarchaeota archaeon]
MSRDFEAARIVNSIPEEYQIVDDAICECGGRFLVKMQSLIENENKMFDILHCICKQCKKQVEFIFDINSFFGKPL